MAQKLSEKKGISEKVEELNGNDTEKTVAKEFIDDKKTRYVKFKKNEKKKMISAYVDKDNYELFKQINDRRGVSSNQILSTFINDYVNEYPELVEQIKKEAENTNFI